MQYRVRHRVGQPALLLVGILAFRAVFSQAVPAEKRLDLDIPLPEGTALFVENLLGSIQVVGGGPPGSVKIAGRAIAELPSPEDPALFLQALTLVPERSDGVVTVHVPFPLERSSAFYPPRESEAMRRTVEGWLDALAALVNETNAEYQGKVVRIGKVRGSVGLAVHLVVTVPDGCNASFDLRAGSIHVSRTRGKIQAHVGEGRLLAEQAYGSLELQTERADATLRTFKGESLRVETTTGNVSLVDVDAKTSRIATGSGGCEATRLSGGAITAATGEGDLFLGGLEAESYELSTVSGSLTLVTNLDRSPKGLLKSISGDVLVRVGRLAPFRMNIATNSGGIRAEGDSIRLTSTSKTAGVVERGTGGGEIRVETGSGSVRVAQRS